MASMQGSGAGGDGKESKDKSSSSSDRKDHSTSKRNEPAEIGALRGAAKTSPKDSSGSDRKDHRPTVKNPDGVKSHSEVMRERRMRVYGETASQASRIGADDHTRSVANRAWRSAVESKMEQGTLSDFDRSRWVSDYGTIKTRAHIRADYESSFFESRAERAWNQGNYGEWAQYKAQAYGSEIKSSFESFKAAPLDTIADLTRNPLVAGALSMTGIGAGGLAAIQLTDTVADAAQDEADALTALRTAAVDAINTTPIGDGLGMMKNIITTGLTDPDDLPSAVAGQAGSMVGGRVTADIAQKMLRNNPLMGAAVGASGSVIGKFAATKLASTSKTASEAAKDIPRSPLVSKAAPKPKTNKPSKSALGSPERAIEQQEELANADALALVRDYQTTKLSNEGPLPYYNTLQPYKMA